MVKNPKHGYTAREHFRVLMRHALQIILLGPLQSDQVLFNILEAMILIHKLAM